MYMHTHKYYYDDVVYTVQNSNRGSPNVPHSFVKVVLEHIKKW